MNGNIGVGLYRVGEADGGARRYESGALERGLGIGGMNVVVWYGVEG